MRARQGRGQRAGGVAWRAHVGHGALAGGGGGAEEALALRVTRG
jgi:hypothetical protein